MFNQMSNESLNGLRYNMELLNEQVESMNYTMSPGYKKRVTTFHDTVDGMRKQTRVDFSSGMATRTHRDLDFAIQGDGFFEVMMPDGSVAYTKDGSFQVSPEGKLVTQEGFEVVTSSADKQDGNSGSYSLGLSTSAIVIPVGTRVNLRKDGVLVDQMGEELGKLSLVTFNNLDGLKEINNSLYQPTLDAGEMHDVAIGDMIGETRVMQGFLESSNASVTDAMSRIQQLNKAVNINMKLFKTLDQMHGDLNSTISRNI